MDQRVVVTDINMPFGSMVNFMVKWAIASIPALIIIAMACYMAAGAVMLLVAAMAPQ